jgi:hypothetical protein
MNILYSWSQQHAPDILLLLSRSPAHVSLTLQDFVGKRYCWKHESISYSHFPWQASTRVATWMPCDESCELPSGLRCCCWFIGPLTLWRRNICPWGLRSRRLVVDSYRGGMTLGTGRGNKKLSCHGFGQESEVWELVLRDSLYDQ